MNILPGTLMPIGMVKAAASNLTTSPKMAGSPQVGAGAQALFDGRTPGKTPPAQMWEPIVPRILDEPSKTLRPGSLFNFSV